MEVQKNIETIHDMPLAKSQVTKTMLELKMLVAYLEYETFFINKITVIVKSLNLIYNFIWNWINWMVQISYYKITTIFIQLSSVLFSSSKLTTKVWSEKMKFSIKYISSKCDQIRSFPWSWSCFLKKSLIENFIFCAVYSVLYNVSSLSINVLDCPDYQFLSFYPFSSQSTTENLKTC